ncbi:carbon-nitrogen hydrolase family protein [Actinopolymorpha pittospori]|uniref:Amidohydrolase n=1 Tax=Actinopolymorpha pittospori TaxID=648752 RepID=A0A927MUW9_9ACTN|nr:carbon-nitrogen hydrolase family protein [Actinopolymorpha pittospori]MBE1606659.1 putative amidohydrolase [Actinopolymorpha pittospori]
MPYELEDVESPVPTVPRRGPDAPPRKVVVGTVIFGAGGDYPGLRARAGELAALVEELAARAARRRPDRGLDLVVLPEAVLTPNAELAKDRSIAADDPVLDVFRDLARRYRSYLVVPLDLVEATPSGSVYSNAALLLDRRGALVGTYRKAHPVGVGAGSTLEGGVRPGAEYPVFDCDFGRLGIQICWDVVYDDGWAALAARGAEIVAFSSASPATIRTAAHAARHRYFVVSSTPRDNATVYEPTGLVAARIEQHGEVLVHELDLSHVLLGWSPTLRDGAALREKYGERVGFHYDDREDIGLFWSNDPTTSVEAMVRSIGVEPIDAQIARNLAQRGEALR